MDGVTLPQMLLYLTSVAGQTSMCCTFVPCCGMREKQLPLVCHPHLVPPNFHEDVDLKTLSLSTLVFLSLTMGSYSSALIPDTEDFNSVVSMAEKLNEQVAHAADERLQSDLQTLVTLMMEKETKGNQSEEPDSSTLPENSQETSQNESAPSAAAPKSEPTQSFTSLLPKALSAVLHLTPPPGLTSDPQPSRDPPNLEQLQTELRDLRDQFHLMKSQHNKEIKLLMNELDEEKRIRLTLQMEIQRMKKHMSK